MKERPISKMYIIGCDFSPFTHERWKKDKYECIQIEYNGRYTRLVEKDSLLLSDYRNMIRLIAYEKEKLVELEKEIKMLNDFYKDSKLGTYHFYIKKLNSGNNYFKLLPTKSSGNFHSHNKKLHGFYFEIKPTKNYKQHFPITDFI